MPRSEITSKAKCALIRCKQRARSLRDKSKSKGSGMAIYRFSAKTIKRSAGRSATAAAAYRSGERIVDERTGEVHDYTGRGGVVETFVAAPEQAPAWAHDRAALWNAVETGERRKDAQVAREVQLALPAELDAGQRRELVREFVQAEFADAGMVADVAIHAPDKDGDDRNHHAHVMLTMRDIGPDGFGKKNRDWNAKEKLAGWREAWQEHANRALERAGSRERIDHRSLTAQRDAAIAAGDTERAAALDRAPEPKLGPIASIDLRQSRRTGEPLRTDRAEQYQRTKAENAERASLGQRCREAWRQVADRGATAFRDGYRQVRDGMAKFRENAKHWQAERQQAREQARKAELAKRWQRDRSDNRGMSR